MRVLIIYLLLVLIGQLTFSWFWLWAVFAISIVVKATLSMIADVLKEHIKDLKKKK